MPYRKYNRLKLNIMAIKTKHNKNYKLNNVFLTIKFFVNSTTVKLTHSLVSSVKNKKTRVLHQESVKIIPTSPNFGD